MLLSLIVVISQLEVVLFCSCYFRYVVIGCSHDSWAYGAGDPGIGLAVLTEIAEKFSQAVQKGWRPRRSILFISWDANLYASSGVSHWLQVSSILILILPSYSSSLLSRYISSSYPCLNNFSLQYKFTMELFWASQHLCCLSQFMIFSFVIIIFLLPYLYKNLVCFHATVETQTRTVDFEKGFKKLFAQQKWNYVFPLFS